jgi:hypothetical protein
MLHGLQRCCGTYPGSLVGQTGPIREFCKLSQDLIRLFVGNAISQSRILAKDAEPTLPRRADP